MMSANSASNAGTADEQLPRHCALSGNFKELQTGAPRYAHHNKHTQQQQHLGNISKQISEIFLCKYFNKQMAGNEIKYYFE